jgi:nitroreductase
MSYDLFETMRSTRSMRRLKPDAIPDDVLGQVLEAGTYAANGGNMQTWRFVVIRDAAIKAAAGAWYRKSWHEIVGPRYRSAVPAPGHSAEQFGRMLAAAEYLADHIHEAPVWIVPCAPGARNTGSSIFPAVQNILLACRALGLGCTLTTLHLNFEKDVEAALGLPDDVRSYAILPIGYPMGKFGRVRRAPLESVVYQDRWGEAYRAHPGD